MWVCCSGSFDALFKILDVVSECEFVKGAIQRDTTPNAVAFPTIPIFKKIICPYLGIMKVIQTKKQKTKPFRYYKQHTFQKKKQTNKTLQFKMYSI